MKLNYSLCLSLINLVHILFSLGFVSLKTRFDVGCEFVIFFFPLFALLNSVPRTHIDDEYAHAAEKDPKILLTTSRDPSAPLQQFVKVCSLQLRC